MPAERSQWQGGVAAEKGVPVKRRYWRDVVAGEGRDRYEEELPSGVFGINTVQLQAVMISCELSQKENFASGLHF